MKRLCKFICIVMTIALLSVSLFGCMIEEIPGASKKEVVATVNGEKIYKENVTALYNAQKANYGITADVEKDATKKADIQKFKESILESLIAQKVVEQKDKSMGIKLTDQEKSNAQQQAKQTLDQYRQSLVTQYQTKAKTDKTINPTKKAEEDLKSALKQQGYDTEQKFTDAYVQDTINQKLYSQTVKSVKANSSEIQKYYDDNVKTQKDTYTKTPSQYETDVGNNELVLYQPSGYVRVKHILISIPEADRTNISNLESSKKTEEAKAARDKALAAIKSKADEVLKKVNAKEDFDKLIETYGEDPGMKQSPYKEKGYLLGNSSQMVAEFKNAGLALKNVGDVTGLVASDYGYHIIKLVEKVKEGPVALDTVKSSVEAKVISQKQSQLWQDTLTQWEKQAKIVRHTDKL